MKSSLLFLLTGLLLLYLLFRGFLFYLFFLLKWLIIKYYTFTWLWISIILLFFIIFFVIDGDLLFFLNLWKWLFLSFFHSNFSLLSLPSLWRTELKSFLPITTLFKLTNNHNDMIKVETASVFHKLFDR